jgi:hypothetical protein
MDGATEIFEQRRNQCAAILQRLLAAPAYSFDDRLRSQLPAQHGLYVIAQKNSPQCQYLHAGESPRAGLRERIWTQHYCGGDAKRGSSDLIQKVMDNHRLGRPDAKLWVRENCIVQWLVLEDDDVLRCWAEHYMLSLLRPIWGR